MTLALLVTILCIIYVIIIFQSQKVFINFICKSNPGREYQDNFVASLMCAIVWPLTIVTIMIAFLYGVGKAIYFIIKR